MSEEAPARAGVEESIGQRRRRDGRGEAVAGWVWEFERDLVGGVLMGAVVHTVVALTERVKLQLGRARRLWGFADCVERIVRDEGVLSRAHRASRAGWGARHAEICVAMVGELVIVYYSEVEIALINCSM